MSNPPSLLLTVKKPLFKNNCSPWVRYVYDILVYFKDVAKLNSLDNYTISINPHIKFILEIEEIETIKNKYLRYKS